ncbi:MAG TPA: FimV/HubP family polar landmark protein [Gammaproteobacteria bacterium]|nr:FimV/HubP family polar landmark protein [Gammaproteobacteria bacterium]
MIQHYFPMAVLAIAFFLIIVLLLVPRKKKLVHVTPSAKKSPHVITSNDIKAIAGDNEIATQLDLARAYLEIGKKTLAKQILEYIIQHGDADQQRQAQYLLSLSV